MLFHPALDLIPISEQPAFLKASRNIQLKKKEVLFTVGSLHTDFYVIGNGMLRVEVSGASPAGLTHAGFLGQHSIVAEPTENGQFRATMRVTAVLDACIFAVPIKVIHEVIHRYPVIGIALIRQQLRENQKLFRQIARLNAATPERAVGRAMYDIAGIDGHGDRVVDKRIKQADLAAATGMSREQVNRVLKALTAQGLVLKTDEGYKIDESFGPTNYSPLA